jgi:hypothetical protein
VQSLTIHSNVTADIIDLIQALKPSLDYLTTLHLLSERLIQNRSSLSEAYDEDEDMPIEEFEALELKKEPERELSRLQEIYRLQECLNLLPNLRDLELAEPRLIAGSGSVIETLRQMKSLKRLSFGLTKHMITLDSIQDIFQKLMNEETHPYFESLEINTTTSDSEYVIELYYGFNLCPRSRRQVTLNIKGTDAEASWK